MNWEAFGAIAEFAGAIAIFVTLVYLAIQVRQGNKQRELEAFRHTWDSLNQFCDLLTQSTENASIVNRGRQSLSNLNDDDYTVFEHIHLRMLNTIESWYQQVVQTSPPGDYRDQQLDNIAGVVQMYIDHPGVRDFWKKVRDLFVPVQQIVDANISQDD